MNQSGVLRKIKLSDFLLVPNLLSLLRIGIVLPFVLALHARNYPLVFFTLIIGIVSDALDGYFARKLNQITELGKILDPLADKIGIGALVLVLITDFHFPIWLAVVIIARDVLILIGSFILSTRVQSVPPSNFLGKITVNIIAADLILYMVNVRWLQPYFDFLTLIFIIASFVGYVKTFLMILRGGSNDAT